MVLNLNKTKEIVFHRPRPSKPILPPCFTNIERVTTAKLLGIYLTDTCSFSEHVNFIIRQCMQRMFLLRTLRNKGLPPASLQVVFSALIVSRILYAISSWGGFLNTTEKQKIDKVLLKSHNYGYCSKPLKFESLLENADGIVFQKAQNSEHCLNHLLPDVRESVSTLRRRGHPYVLPTCSYELFKRSFFTRVLFKLM